MQNVERIGASERGEEISLTGLLVRVPWQAGVAVAAFVAFLALAMIVPSLGSNIFDSPDETSNYIFTQTFAEEGKLWYEKDYLYLDEENLLHPRGALTHEGRIVPFNFLGLPVIYGSIQRFTGDHIEILAVVLAATCAWALYRASSVMFGARAWEAWVVALGFSPLIYYLNHPYMNATLAITFLALGTWLFARYYKLSLRRDLVVASCFVALSIFCRYEYILFLSPLMLWGLYLKHGSFFSKGLVLDGAIYAAALIGLFFVPLALLNQATYGDWHTYGYSLFNDVYFPERNPSEELSATANLGRSIRGVLLPSYPVKPGEIFTNLSYLTFLILPVFSLLGLAGAGLLARSRRIPLWKLLPIALLVVYVIVYRGSNDTWRAFASEPGYNAAAVRYWLPFYLVVFFLATYAFVRTRDAILRTAMVAGLLFTGTASVYTLSDTSVTDLRDAVSSYEEWGANVLVPNTEPDAIVYAGRGDKRIVSLRDTAAWWSGEEFYDPAKVGASMARVSSQTGRPVYILKEREVDINALNGVLAGYQQTVVAVGRTGLYKLEPLP